MSLEELKNLVILGENEQLEFKRKANHPEKIIREIVAFANTRGGKLLIGVDDNGTIPGLRDAGEEKYVLEQAINDCIVPKVDFDLTIIPINQKKSIISYHIFESKNKPHYVIEDPKSQTTHAYIRVEDKTMKASKEIRQILRKKDKGDGVHFNYGRKENILMKYLELHTSITLSEFQRIANLPRWIASKTLVRLVLANVLAVEVAEKEDKFIRK